MRERFNIIVADRMLALTFLLSFVMIVFQFVFIALNFVKLPPLTPLLYQQPWGLKQVVQKEFLFILPGATLLFMAVDVFLAIALYPKIPLLSRMFFWGNLFTALLSTISSIRIVLLIV